MTRTKWRGGQSIYGLPELAFSSTKATSAMSNIRTPTRSTNKGCATAWGMMHKGEDDLDLAVRFGDVNVYTCSLRVPTSSSHE